MKPSVFDFLTFFRQLIALFDIFHPMTAGGSIKKWSTLTWSDGIGTSRWSRNWSSHLSHVRSIQQRFRHSWICWIIKRGAKWRFLFWISYSCSHTKSSSDFAYFITSILRCLERNMVVLTKKETSRLSQAHSCKLKFYVGEFNRKLEKFRRTIVLIDCFSHENLSNWNHNVGISKTELSSSLIFQTKSHAAYIEWIPWDGEFLKVGINLNRSISIHGIHS